MSASLTAGIGRSCSPLCPALKLLSSRCWWGGESLGPPAIVRLARPARGAWPAHISSADKRSYDLATIKKWLEVFLTRFFAQSQFKRSAIPNGPKISSGGSLSPRGDWRAPSDSSASPWLEELRRNVP